MRCRCRGATRIPLTRSRSRSYSLPMGRQSYNVELSTPASVAPQTGTQAVDRAAELLALVVEAAAPRSFTALVEQTGLAKSTVSRLLQALERHRLVQRDRGGAFRPGAVFALCAVGHELGGEFVELETTVLDRRWAMYGVELRPAVSRGVVAAQ